MAIPKGDVPEPPTLAMQHEVIQRVSSALAALPDHERDAVVLRYYENLPPREVAKRLEVPVETARTRIRRGLEHLRRLLDERHDGQRAAWAAPLGLLLPTAPSAASTIAIVAKFAMLAAVLVLGIHVVRTVMDRGGRAGDSPSPATTAQAEAPVLRGRAATEPEPRLGEPVEASDPPGTGPESEAPPPAAAPEVVKEYEVLVRVTDHTGSPVPDLGICELTRGAGGPLDVTSRSLGRTDPAGRAVVVVAASPDAMGLGLELGAAAPWKVERAPHGLPGEGEEAVFMVVPRTLVRGTVLDAQGEPLPGVRVLARVWVRSQAGTNSMEFIQLDPTDDSGRFSATFPQYAQEAILSVRTSEATASVRFDPLQQAEVVLRLEPEALIQGEVVQEDGRPLIRPEHLMPRVVAIPTDGGDNINGTFTPGTNRFAIFVRAGGQYCVALTWPMGRASPLATPDVVQAEAPVEGLRIVCPTGMRLTGQIEGDQVSGFSLDWLRRRSPTQGPDVRRSVRSGPEGQFAFEGLMEGNTTLYVSRRGDDRYALIEDVRLPDESLVIHLQEGLTVEGSIRGFVGRQGFDLYLSFLWRGPTIHAQVQEDGSFRVTGLPPGIYQLRWERAGQSGEVDRQVQAGESGVEIVLPEEVLQAGTVREGAR